MMIKFAVCDDEPAMARELSARLSGYMEEKKTDLYRIECFADGRSLLESGCDFDLIFLDIQMDQMNGMETARALRQKNRNGLLIFVTILKEYVFDAFEVQAYDYLVKPLDAGRFGRTMNRALETLERQRTKRIVIQKGLSCEVLQLSGILYCEVQGRKLYIHQRDGTIVDYYDRLDAFEKRVDRRFFRCHRSYLVNLDYVKGCNAGQIVLTGGGRIPVSRLRERELMQALLRHMKERKA